MTFTEIIDFFHDTASKGMQKDDNCGWTSQRCVHFTEGSKDIEEDHQILNSGTETAPKVPDELWYALLMDVCKQINAARRSLTRLQPTTQQHNQSPVPGDGKQCGGISRANVTQSDAMTNVGSFDFPFCRGRPQRRLCRRG